MTARRLAGLLMALGILGFGAWFFTQRDEMPWRDPMREPMQSEQSGAQSQTEPPSLSTDIDDPKQSSRRPSNSATESQSVPANIDSNTELARAFAGEISLAEALARRAELEQLSEAEREAMRDLMGIMCVGVTRADPDGDSVRATLLMTHLYDDARAYCSGIQPPRDHYERMWRSPVSSAPTPTQAAMQEEVSEAAEQDNKQAGLGVALAELDAALYAADYPMVVAVIGELVRHGWLSPPIAEAPHSIQMYDTRLSVFAANVLLCDQLGGCGPTHPLTLHICLSNYGDRLCVHPQNPMEAVMHQEAGLRFEVFQVLVGELRGLLAAYRGGRL